MPEDELPAPPDPTPAGDRGFLLYGGGPVGTSYGHSVRVQESSIASDPRVWLFVDDTPLSLATGVDSLHLSLIDAIEVRDRLTQFIDGVPERWTDGHERLAEARRIVAERRAGPHPDRPTHDKGEET